MPEKPKIRVPIRELSDEEDAEITAAALSDPDSLPWSDEDFERAEKFYGKDFFTAPAPETEVKE